MAGQAKTVLIVEDDVFLMALLKNRMESEGFSILAAKDGEEAIKVLKDIKPDIILLDIILPGKSGFEVLEEMQSDPQIQNSPVMIISNLGQDMDIDRGRDLGALEYFVKARSSMDDVIVKVSNFLKNKK
ncbi:MAG: hypothetical protein A3I24_04025 [Candidatus Harrisonbacteria bacterium RIFCSPLOWO2_02_FULL_41_13b]|uniref:Response regulatory domain-containing protein n=1 Tax=Candidatus Harrisonbacteria bacterium RIFCSPLOWO2_02_FULL_41_13b TaxID=1798409 RepID=A0A1G1ZQU6_9BACT|nr:MAG: hypothetical protein A3J53_00235 [Candidatus Harrisonbacteria bacterium RIFCSPHIGHO2_02_FULL_40_20]OGY66829.1 MAG: hypothetical protein A3I24_04025 [Candidatus Harrisonbacteria bacterium RIFCSPLOWO2_02_FULL_41_13b]